MDIAHVIIQQQSTEKANIEDFVINWMIFVKKLIREGALVCLAINKVLQNIF